MTRPGSIHLSVAVAACLAVASVGMVTVSTDAAPFNVPARNIQTAIHSNIRQALKPVFTVRSRYAAAMTAGLFDTSGSWFISANAMGSWQLWSLKTGQRVHEFQGHRGAITDLVFLGTKPSFASSGVDGSILVWEYDDKQAGGGQQRLLQRLEGHVGAVNRIVSLSRGTSLLSAGQDGAVRLWQVASGKQERTMNDPSPAVTMAVSNDEKLVAVAHADGVVRIRQIATGMMQAQLAGSGAAVSALSWSPSGDRLAAGLDNGHVALWRTGQWQAPAQSVQVSDQPVRTLTFSPDGGLLAAAGDDANIQLWPTTDLAGPGRKLVGHQGRINQLAFSHDGQTLSSVSADLTARFWSVLSGTELVRMVSIKSGWAAVAPSGLFDGTLDGEVEERLDAVRWNVGQQSFGVDGFLEGYYRPTLMAKLLSGRPIDMPAAAAVADGFDLPPKVEITSVTPVTESGADDGDRIQVTLRVESQGSGGISGVRLFHNDKIVDPELAQESSREEGRNGTEIRTITYRVSPVDGNNRFTAVGLSKDRIEGEMVQSSYAHASSASSSAHRPPEIHLFVIGINRYKNAKMNLSFSVADASGVRDYLAKNIDPLYKNVHVYDIFDEQATKSMIEQRWRQLKESAPQDTVVIYLAGHGVALQDRWFFIPHDNESTSERYIQEHAVPSSSMADLIASIGARNVLLLIDACYSGALLDALVNLENNRPMALLSRSTGIHVATATSKTQEAAEVADLGHGVFTYSLLSGLKGEADKDPVDGRVSAKELLAHVKTSVPILSKKYDTEEQTPLINMRGGNFVLLFRK
ncbi:MAG: caspase family protein [Magnetococcales bacterium]|nr:caspase family protein [Magnetococcales bacterium]